MKTVAYFRSLGVFIGWFRFSQGEPFFAFHRSKHAWELSIGRLYACIDARPIQD